MRQDQCFQQRDQILRFQRMQQSAPARGDIGNAQRFQRAFVNLQMRALSHQRHYIARLRGVAARRIVDLPFAEYVCVQHLGELRGFEMHRAVGGFRVRRGQRVAQPSRARLLGLFGLYRQTAQCAG